MPFVESEASRKVRLAQRQIKAYAAGVSLRLDLHTAGRSEHGLAAYFQRKVGNHADAVERQLVTVDQELAELGRARRRRLRVLSLRSQRARLRRTAGRLEEVRKVEA